MTAIGAPMTAVAMGMAFGSSSSAVSTIGAILAAAVGAVSTTRAMQESLHGLFEARSASYGRED